MTEKEKRRKALIAITAWRQLDALSLFTEKEKFNIQKRITERFKDELSPLRK